MRKDVLARSLHVLGMYQIRIMRQLLSLMVMRFQATARYSGQCCVRRLNTTKSIVMYGGRRFWRWLNRPKIRKYIVENIPEVNSVKLISRRFPNQSTRGQCLFLTPYFTFSKFEHRSGFLNCFILEQCQIECSSGEAPNEAVTLEFML